MVSGATDFEVASAFVGVGVFVSALIASVPASLLPLTPFAVPTTVARRECLGALSASSALQLLCGLMLLDADVDVWSGGGFGVPEPWQV
ncbi:hypothetical protein HDU96_001741 [Phlyctochytrium bullatum]|nr:hypothetical protein HDU96_001741 [Phlyctochytrium bullatum]